MPYIELLKSILHISEDLTVLINILLHHRCPRRKMPPWKTFCVQLSRGGKVLIHSAPGSRIMGIRAVFSECDLRQAS